MSEPLEDETNPTIELGLQHIMDGSADQFPHACNAPDASLRTGGIIVSGGYEPGSEALYLPKGAQVYPQSYAHREELGYRPEVGTIPTPAQFHIEISPDLDKDALMTHIRETMDKAAAQLRAPSKHPPVMPEPEDSGYISQDGRYIPSKTEIREFIREEIDRALHPGTVDPRQYRHVDITDSDDTRWRGMVYLVEPMEGSKG